MILFIALGVPVGWHMAALSTNIPWIGWSENWISHVPEQMIGVFFVHLEGLRKKNSKVSAKKMCWAVGFKQIIFVHLSMAPV